MKINSLYQGGYSADSGEISILYEYLSQFDNNQLKTFLYYGTGVTSLKEGGFKEFTLVFNK